MTDAARLTAALADRYRVERELGQGGMATVYLAYDVRHDRRVALKVLRPELSAILGAGRFLHEIRTTANLQHPHILSLFDSGEADGLVYYVMPYVEGESLRDRLNREKQLPVDDALRIAGEVADALEYAHQHGVVHRDIKPENILLHGGHAMVADFGIALAASRSEGSTRMTETGMSLGTPYYMSPEQSMGEREITPRADIYALGCVLYEMLTAEPPFTGATAQAIIARVMTEQPRSLTMQRKSIPPHVEAAVERALEKLPADRFASAADFAAALKNGAGWPAGRGARAASAPPRRARWLPWAVAAVAVVGAVAGWMRPGLEAARHPPVVHRYELFLEDSIGLQDNTGSEIDVASDGSVIAYASQSGIMVRYADRTAIVPAPGGRRGTNPTLSPDGRWITFLEGNRLSKVPLAGGASVAICDSCQGYQFHWGTDDTIRFHSAPAGNLARRVLMAVSARGGTPRILAQPDSGSGELFRAPLLLPGRRTVIFSVFRTAGASRVAALDLNSGRITRFDLPGFAIGYVASGFLVLGNPDGAISAVPFDAERVAITGEPIGIASGALGDLTSLRAGVAENGTLAFARSGAEQHRQLTLVSRTGAAMPLGAEPNGYAGPRFSPDGRRIAVHIMGETGRDVWVFDIAARALSRLTTNGISDRPMWMPDGRHLAYSSNDDLWLMTADGSGQRRPLLEAVGSRWPGGVTPDGRIIVFHESSSGTTGIRQLVIDSAPAATTIIPDAFSESNPVLSPDGRWLAYQSTEAGRSEIYVRPFPGLGARIPVSVRGGTEPVWARNARELFYRAGDSLMVATYTAAPDFRVTARQRLFAGRFLRSHTFREYDVAPDGRSFVMIGGSRESASISVMHNVFDRLAWERSRQRTDDRD